MREGDGPVNKTSRKSLKLLGTVGEPINPEAWMWYYKTVGNSKCPIVDTWWQTETGGIMIAPQTGAIPLKPGLSSQCNNLAFGNSFFTTFIPAPYMAS